MNGEPTMLAGIIAAVLIGTTCACLGVYVVLRRMAFVGDALAHTVLPGLVVAMLLGRSTFVGALVAGLITALGIGFITPPLGLNLFVVSGVTQVPVVSISRYAVPFVLTMIVVVIILGFFPGFSLWLLR